MRFGRSSPEWSEQQRTEIAPVGPENLRVAHLNMLDQKSRAKRPLAASQTKAQRKQAKQERKKATSSRKKKANMRLTKGNQTLVPATDEERVTNLELAIFHVFANKQLALDALDVRDKRSSTYRLAIVGDLLLLLAPADKWMETSLTAGQSLLLDIEELRLISLQDNGRNFADRSRKTHSLPNIASTMDYTSLP